MNRKLPKNIMHEPAVMAWAETTPLSEHKAREAKGIELINYTKKDPMPLSRATTELRGAFPYIFDCAAYVKTHYPERIQDDLFYSVFAIPYDAFLNYCLDGCTEQTQYLKEEMYRILKGQPAKYIKVSESRTILAQPIVLALSHTDLKTGKDKRIINIKQDAKVDMVQVMILKELLEPGHGYLNVPKAMYAKTRRIISTIREIVGPFNNLDRDFWDKIREIKKSLPFPITNQEGANVLKSYERLEPLLTEIEQGEYHPVYLALEYIIGHRGKETKAKEYSLLGLCEKCYPQLVQHRNGQLYFDRGKEKALSFLGALRMIIALHDKSLGIERLEATETRNGDIFFNVCFT